MDEQDDQYVEYFPRSPSKAITHATPAPKTHFEDWMVNLGRGRNKEWLTGPRPKEWFTGLNPENCPGRFGFLSYACLSDTFYHVPHMTIVL
jgi:hypothetical protein